MDLKNTDQIIDLRRETQRLMREAEKQAASKTITDEQSDAFDRVAIELYDLDSALYEAPFVNNDSEIQRLIGEIKAATAAAHKLQFQLDQLRSALEKARSTIQGATAQLSHAKTLLDETSALVSLISGN